MIDTAGWPVWFNVCKLCGLVYHPNPNMLAAPP